MEEEIRLVSDRTPMASFSLLNRSQSASGILLGMSKRKKRSRAEGENEEPERPRLFLPDDILGCVVQYLVPAELFRCE
jgi:hypothetical protein